MMLLPIFIVLPRGTGKTKEELRMAFVTTMAFTEARLIAGLKKGPYAFACQGQQARLN